MRPGAQQVRLHGSRGGVFVDHRPPRDPGDPLHLQNYYLIYSSTVEILRLYRRFTHTHPAVRRVFLVQKRWRWGWRGEWGWDESEGEMKKYLTGTGGERKRRGEEQTPTPTHLARSGETLKGQEKRKAEADRHGTRPAEGEKDGSAWTNLTQRNLRPPIGTHRTQLTWGGKNAWNSGPNGELVEEERWNNNS